MSDTFLLIFGGILLIGFGILAYLIVRGKSGSGQEGEMLRLVNDRIDRMAEEMRQSMQENVRHQQTTGHQMTGVVRDVTERLVKIEETNKQVLNFSGQLENLQRILTNPKQRGILGEYYLETILKTVFAPDQYQMQYAFKDGEIVDAAIFIQDKIVPVDSKFSLENYNRLVEAQDPSERANYEKVFINDLKNRIKETSKYIRPEEGTMEFAFMFIPHEAIYYDLLVNKIGEIGEDTESLLQRASTKYHVIIVSPTSFTAYLQTVLQGLRALKIEEQAKEIRARVGDLGRHLAQYDESFTAIGKHLGTVVNKYNDADKALKLIDKDVLKISGSGTGHIPSPVDKPLIE
ncbi:DNA recombination protein RmuC [Candidatus Uhrbacteria bacterium]|nr:DNA recombination protein RmuC [Candidatus Uhrbacteria bacterium]